jgi:hypothetical protein
MRLKKITKLLKDAHRQDLENKLRQQWLVYLARMDSTNYISCEKYIADAFRVIDNLQLDKEKILKDAEEVRRLVEEGR